MHAEAVLLVDDCEGERGELHTFLEQCVGADHERRAALAQRPAHLLPRLASLPARGECDLDPQRFEPAAKVSGVLVGQQLRRRHERDLMSGLDGPSRGDRRDQRLAAADIALHEAQHGLRESKVRSQFPRAPAPGPASRETAASAAAVP